MAYNFLFATILTLRAVFSLLLESRGRRVWQDYLRLFAWKEIVWAIVRGITHGYCRSSSQGLTFSKIWAAQRLDAWASFFLGSCLEARSREPPIGIGDRLQVSKEPKLPIGARKLVLPVFTTQESSAVAPKQEEEKEKKQIL